MRNYFILIISLVYFNFTNATNHYVDKNANGSNNGTSWTNAWTSFSSINWGTIQPGDNIYISGGTDSTVYNESMTIGKSGAAGNLITVRNGLDAGHNGKVVIDRNYASGNSGAIEIWNQKYLRVAGITIRKVVGSGIYLRGQSTNALKNVYVDSCDISDFRGQGGVYVSGYGNSGNARDYVDSVFIRYNTITTLTYGNYQTDCIYVQYQKSAFVVGNVIHQRNTYNPSQHCDGVQSSDAVNLVVADNYIDLINDNGEANQPDQGIIIGRMTGVVEVYNNIVYTPYLDGYSNSVLVGMASTGTWDIYGNTIVSYTNSNLMKFDLPTSGYVKNNIFYSQRSSAAVIYPSGLAASHIDNNLYYYTTGNTVVSNRGTLSQMRAAGAEINGMNTNPSFINPSGNWRLDPGSSAINAGYTLGNPYNVDISGVSRPQGNGWDIGAYENINNNGNYIIVNSGWNYISIPKLSENMTPDYILPTRTSVVYEFIGGGYQIANTLQNGKGYVVSFSYPQYIFVDGESVNFPIQVVGGWNLIGPFDQNISTSQIYTVPPGIIISDFFECEQNGFTSANVLKIGRGYWVKVGSNGQININSGFENVTSGIVSKAQIKNNWGKIKITDNGGNPITLYSAEDGIESNFYELPPTPPRGMFDVRYSTGKMVEDLSSEKIILINADNYPISIKAEGLRLHLKDMINGDLIDKELNDGEELTITNPDITSLKVIGNMTNQLPVSYQLYQNYPNPFNPSTIIEFSIPQEVLVNLSVFNIIGEKIGEIKNEVMKPGQYSVKFNASLLASGIYMYRIKAGDFVQSKKMLLLK